MTDPRFFRRSGPFALGDIAARIGADAPDANAAALVIEDIAPLEEAGPSDLSYFNDARYMERLAATKAGAVITTREWARHARGNTRLIFADDPRMAFARAGYLFYPPPAVEPGVDVAARIAPTATIGEGCQIDAGAVIGPNVDLGARCHIAANVIIAGSVVIGKDCRIGPNSNISHALIGARVEIGAGVSIGGPGFGFVPGKRGLLRVPQLGRVVIEDDVAIDVNCAIDRGVHGDTVIGAGTVIDNLVQIGHNVRIGRFCAIAGQSGIAGSAVIGDGVMIGGAVAVSDHVTIGSRARVAIGSIVIRDVAPGASVGGYPALPARQWHRQSAGLLRLFGRKEPGTREEERAPGPMRRALAALAKRS